MSEDEKALSAILPPEVTKAVLGIKQELEGAYRDALTEQRATIRRLRRELREARKLLKAARGQPLPASLHYDIARALGLPQVNERPKPRRKRRG